MSSAELPCYTIINVPSDFETPNEIQLKNDLEKGDVKVGTVKDENIPFNIQRGNVGTKIFCAGICLLFGFSFRCVSG